MRLLNRLKSFKSALPGVTLVELLIAMALMGFVMLSISNFVIKSNVNSASLSARFKEAQEIHTFIQDLQADLRRGAYINPQSFRNRLEYTTYDPATGVAVKKVYGICYYSAVQTSASDTTCPVAGGANTIPYLKLSTDAGATWGSPYRISGFNKYRLSTVSTPKFLYAHATNDCWDFTDDNSNGVRGPAEAYAAVNCSALSSPGATDSNITNSSKNPQTASKVILADFNFTAGVGSPEAVRNLPRFIFIAVGPGLVRDNSSTTASRRDNPLVQSFSYDSAVNPAFPAGYIPKGITWDAGHDVLIMGAGGGSATGKIYRTERNGILVNTPITPSDFNVKLQNVAIDSDGQTLDGIYFDGGSDLYYRYNLSGGQALTPLSVINMGGGTWRWGIALNPLYPDRFYVCELSGGAIKILEYYRATGALTGNSWAMPPAFDMATRAGNFFVEPVTGNFYVHWDGVRTSGGNKYLDIYKVPFSGAIPTTPEFSINLSDISYAAGTTDANCWWGMTYDPALNRLFFNDVVAKRVYEVVPPKLISPRS